MTVGPGMGTPQNNGPYGKRLKGLSTLGTREPVPGYWHKMLLCSHFEFLVCDCVHNSRIYSINRPGARFLKVSVTFRARDQIFKSKYKE